MNRSIAITLAYLALSACAGAPRPRLVAAGLEEELGPIVASSSAGSRTCVLGYAAPLQCVFEEDGRRTIADVPGTEGAVDVAIGNERGCVVFGSGAVGCFEWDGARTTESRLVASMNDAFDVVVAGDVVCARSEAGRMTCAEGDGAAREVTTQEGATAIALALSTGSRGQ